MARVRFRVTESRNLLALVHGFRHNTINNIIIHLPVVSRLKIFSRRNVMVSKQRWAYRSFVSKFFNVVDQFT